MIELEIGKVYITTAGDRYIAPIAYLTKPLFEHEQIVCISIYINTGFQTVKAYQRNGVWCDGLNESMRVEREVTSMEEKEQVIKLIGGKQ